MLFLHDANSFSSCSAGPAPEQSTALLLNEITPNTDTHTHTHTKGWPLLLGQHASSVGRSKAATGASITATHSNLTLQINALTQRKALLAATQSYRKLHERTANSWHAWPGPCSRWSVRWHKSRPKDGTPWTASAATYALNAKHPANALHVVA